MGMPASLLFGLFWVEAGAMSASIAMAEDRKIDPWRDRVNSLGREGKPGVSFRSHRRRARDGAEWPLADSVAGGETKINEPVRWHLGIICYLVRG